MKLRVEPIEGGDGIEFVDPIERHRYSLETPETVTPEPASVDRFLFPVDLGVGIQTSALYLPTVVPVYVRDETGEMLAEAEHFAHESFDHGEYSIEICAPIKIYLRVDSALTVRGALDGMYIEFDDCTEVLVGGRSHQKHPIGTVTTSDDPADMMAAISTFGSALKTTSPERSYPTLRGHPPMIDRGDELHIPDGLNPPCTGITVEVPPEYRSVFVVASLAYYLGATVEPGASPRLRTDDGFDHSLRGHAGFEGTVEETLKQVFFLDCVTRTEGFYRIDLHERRAVEAAIDLDFADLYSRSIAERLEAYLRVPFETIKPHLPEWKLTTHVEAVPRTVEQLPFVVNDLAVIRSSDARTITNTGLKQQAAAAFTRQDVVTRSASASAGGDLAFVQPEQTNSLEHAWIGESTPVGASKTTLEAFHNRLDRKPSTGDIDITVVCNETEMAEEGDLVDDVYGSRDRLPFDVRVERNLTRSKLRELLLDETDFLHYIGHIDREGIQCHDGKLDAAKLDRVGVDAFLLNACESYNQGMHLIEAGAIGGVVTLNEVVNSGAVRIGRAMARLLNSGFPLRAALTIARDESIMGGQYIVVGDGGLAIAQSESGVPQCYEVERANGAFRVHIKTFPTTQKGIGTTFIPYIEGNETHFLGSGSRKFDVTEEELDRFLQLDDFPVLLGGSLRWSYQLDAAEI